MKFPFAFIGKPSVSLVQQKRAAWTAEDAAKKADRYEGYLIACLFLTMLAFLVLFVMLLGQLP